MQTYRYYENLANLKLLVVERVVSVILQEGQETVQLSAFLILHWVGLVTSLEEVNGWETLNLNTWNVNLVGSRIHLCNHDVTGLRLNFSTEFIPDRS